MVISASVLPSYNLCWTYRSQAQHKLFKKHWRWLLEPPWLTWPIASRHVKHAVKHLSKTQKIIGGLLALVGGPPLSLAHPQPIEFIGLLSGMPICLPRWGNPIAPIRPIRRESRRHFLGVRVCVTRSHWESWWQTIWKSRQSRPWYLFPRFSRWRGWFFRLRSWPLLWKPAKPSYKWYFATRYGDWHLWTSDYFW